MTKSIAGIALPDSKLANEAAELLHEYGDPLLWNHSHRIFLFGSLLGRQENQKYDPELLYVSAVFHDLGLAKHYRSPDKRFEIDGANAARSLLEQHGLTKESTQLVWDAIALLVQRFISNRAGSAVVEGAGSHAIYMSQPHTVTALIKKAVQAVKGSVI